MTDETGVITHPKFRMWLRPDGIVHLVWASAAVMTLDDAISAIEAMAQLTDGRQTPLLVDTSDAGPIERSARSKFVDRNDLVSAVALIVGTPLSRVFGNFFVALSKPIAPVRLFDDDASAVAWLGGFLGS